MWMKHEYKVGVALSEPEILNHLQYPLTENTPWCYIQLTKNLIKAETVLDKHIVTIKHCYIFDVALSQSAIISHQQRP